MRNLKFNYSNFQKYGYSLVSNFYSSSVMSDAIEWIDAITNSNDNCSLLRIYDKSINDETILNRIENTINDDHDALRRLLLNEELLSLLAEVFNGNTPALFKDKLNFKPPGCRADLVHQDQASGWNMYTDYFVSVCICIDENTVKNGALRFLSTGKYPRQIVTDDWEPYSNDNPATLPNDEYQVITMKPGDIVVFDSYIPHGSPANFGHTTRRNLFITFNDSTKGDFRHRYYKERMKQYQLSSSIDRRSHQ